MASLMEREKKYLKMAINIKDSGEMEHLRRDFVLLKTGGAMMGNGKMGNHLVLESNHGQMVRNTKGTGRMGSL
jgi:hypothetical protein